MLYRFQDFELDERLYQLRRAGKVVEIEPKVFDVLTYLLHHHDRIVSKDELLERLWPGQVVSETALTRCIMAARRAVRDNGSKQKIIETQHGRGYRFVAAVREQTKEAEPQFENQEVIPSPLLPAPSLTIVGEERNGGILEPLPPPDEPDLPVPPPRQRFWFLGGVVFMGLVLLVGVVVTVQYLSLRPSVPTEDLPVEQTLTLPLPNKPSIVVLPFTNLSGDPEQDYFSDGITEELITTLARFPSLFVIARHSAFMYKGKAVKIEDVGKELGVRYVLEGSVRRAEQQVRINVRLVDVLTGDHLWVERYDRSFSDIFTLQDEIVQKIVTTLKLQLTLEGQGHIVRKRTDSLEAYDYYLRGKESFQRFTKEGNLQARALWEKAIALDPQYAEAYSSLGWTYCAEWIWRWSQDPQTLEQALALAQQAVALDDSLPEAHEVLSWVYAQQQQYDQAIAEGERAIALDPNNADSYANQADVLNLMDRPEEALRMVEQAMRLNPRYPPVYLVVTNLFPPYFSAS
jgi:TolB-like protein/DNA-binding winged helix-turn-helix (wHTH) protein